MWAEDHNIKIFPPNELHEHGLFVQDLGLEPMLQRFRREYIEPITQGKFLFFSMRTN